MKEFWKSVKIWESYWQKFGGFLFCGHGVSTVCQLRTPYSVNLTSSTNFTSVQSRVGWYSSGHELTEGCSSWGDWTPCYCVSPCWSNFHPRGWYNPPPCSQTNLYQWPLKIRLKKTLSDAIQAWRGYTHLLRMSPHADPLIFLANLQTELIYDGLKENQKHAILFVLCVF